jgi:DNA-binding CsgD family transcriptional regulator
VFLSSYRIRQENLVHAYRQTAHGARDGLVLLDDAGRVIDLGPEIERLTGLSSAMAATRSAFGKALVKAMRADGPLLHDHDVDGKAVRFLLRSQPLERNLFGDLSEGPGAAHAVSVTALDRRWGLAYESIATAHKLTPGEARVLEDVLTHGDMTDTSGRLGMARATSRSHLHRIYAKTGTKGFADLCLFAHRFIVPRT